MGWVRVWRGRRGKGEERMDRGTEKDGSRKQPSQGRNKDKHTQIGGHIKKGTIYGSWFWLCTVAGGAFSGNGVGSWGQRWATEQRPIDQILESKPWCPRPSTKRF